MPIDPNEAPKGTIAVEHPVETCPGEICIFYGKKQCADQTCYCDDRKDKTGCYFIEKPPDTNTMEDKYEYLVADTPENFKTIVEWMFTCGTQVKSEIDEGYSHFNVSFLERCRTYRRKKPQMMKEI